MSEVLAMATVNAALVPLEVYLRTTYRPDRDWIDGETKERNMGEQPHAGLQAFLAYIFRANAKEWDIRVFTEQRVQTSATHYRVADVCVIRRSNHFEPIVLTAPLICIEILSRDDRMSEMYEKVDDYKNMGVDAVWVIDPWNRKVFIADFGGSMLPVEQELTVDGTNIRVSVKEMFAELDEVEGA